MQQGGGQEIKARSNQMAGNNKPFGADVLEDIIDWCPSSYADDAVVVDCS